MVAHLTSYSDLAQARECLVDLLLGDRERWEQPDRRRTGRVHHQSLLEQQRLRQVACILNLEGHHQPAAADAVEAKLAQTTHQALALRRDLAEELRIVDHVE